MISRNIEDKLEHKTWMLDRAEYNDALYASITFSGDVVMVHGRKGILVPPEARPLVNMPTEPHYVLFEEDNWKTVFYGVPTTDIEYTGTKRKHTIDRLQNMRAYYQ